MLEIRMRRRVLRGAWGLDGLVRCLRLELSFPLLLCQVAEEVDLREYPGGDEPEVRWERPKFLVRRLRPVPLAPRRWDETQRNGALVISGGLGALGLASLSLFPGAEVALLSRRQAAARAGDSTGCDWAIAWYAKLLPRG
ncbi:unnamed protein product [Effrenium voratum]|nr:unnamed protein product [Effrenium voratum]